MGDFYTEYELFLKLAEAFDRAYEFWITGTFAVIVACYLGKHLLDKTFAIALASLYTLFSANIFIRLYMGRESIGKVRNEIQRFEEFERTLNQVIHVSATPAEYELRHSGERVAEQIVRPTGLLDPEVEVRPARTQVDDLLEELRKVVAAGWRVLVTTLTKRSAEELTSYLEELRIRVRYLHSEIDALERSAILRDLRAGEFDVLVGINLLREGLDLPEVALVAVLDADKEGFLRSTTSLIQTCGRAARNAEGRVILYADRVTGSMQVCIEPVTRSA